MFNFEISGKDWNLVAEKGLPKDGEWCFVIYKTDTSYDYSIGGYSEDEHQFYANFGYGGLVLDADSVIAWALFEQDEANGYLSVD